MGREARFRKDLSMPGMVAEMRRCFERIEDAVSSRGVSLPDCLMSGLAIFALKYPSLLQFDRDARGLGEPSAREGNLRSLFGIGRAPSDSRMRERLDALDPEELRRPFKRLFALAQRGGVLKEYEWLGGRHVLSVDGTGHFSSPTVHCDNCCVKNRRDGSVEYYHQSLCAVLVHPERREVLPVVPPEPILKTDGARKNDCERNASKRLLTALRREHPHLPLLVVEDGLASNGPHVRLLKDLGMNFVLGAKPGDHKALFAWVDELESAPRAAGAEPGVERWETKDADGAEHVFRWSNGAPLNDAHADLEVNFLEYWERRPNGRTRHFSWVTDLRIDRWNAMDLMRAGRARLSACPSGRIENETFNTLKNQGYEFEHVGVLPAARRSDANGLDVIGTLDERAITDRDGEDRARPVVRHHEGIGAAVAEPERLDDDFGAGLVRAILCRGRRPGGCEQGKRCERKWGCVSGHGLLQRSVPGVSLGAPIPASPAAPRRCPVLPGPRTGTCGEH